MGDQYVRPPVIGREPVPRWLVIWRFRATALALLVLILILGYIAFQHLSGATAQDPGLSSLGAIANGALR